VDKADAGEWLQIVADRVIPGRETDFGAVFKALYRLLGAESQSEHVHVVFLSDGALNSWTKKSIATSFDETLLSTARVQGAQGFTVHVVGFGRDCSDWQNMWPIAQATGGTCQEVGLNHLELRRVFTSVAATITSDRSGGAAPPLRASALEIVFDPVMSCAQGCQRSCTVIQHTYHKKRRWQFRDQFRTWHEAQVCIDEKPFAYGGMRVVYKMSDSYLPDVMLVAKRLISTSHGSRKDMLPFSQCTSMAIALRQTFLQALRNVGLSPRMWFVKCFLYEYHRIEGGVAYFVAERYLDGEFIKFNGNNGYVNEQDPGSSEMMQAFSHYTYVKSRGNLMVVDLQGVVDNGALLLTDPQVLSRKKMFGRGDLGIEGFHLFFDKHRCGETCMALKLVECLQQVVREVSLMRDRKCLICMEASSARTMLLPCNHSALCRTCTLRLLEQASPKCPLCRRPIREFQEGVFSTTLVKTSRQ